MKKILFILTLVLFFTLGGKAQKVFTIEAITSGTWYNTKQAWVYDETVYPDDMKLVLNGNLTLIQDQAKSNYRTGAAKDYEDKDGIITKSWYATDEKNRDVDYTMKIEKETGKSSIMIMYDLGGRNFKMFSYYFNVKN